MLLHSYVLLVPLQPGSPLGVFCFSPHLTSLCMSRTVASGGQAMLTYLLANVDADMQVP